MFLPNQVYTFNGVVDPSFVDKTMLNWRGIGAELKHLSTGGYGAGPECVQVVMSANRYVGIKTANLIRIQEENRQKTHTASVYVRIPSEESAASVILSVAWYTEGKTYISSSDLSPAQAIVFADGWQRLVVTDTPPDGAAYVELRILNTNLATAGNSILVDAIQFEVGDIATEFQEFVGYDQKKSVIDLSLNLPSPGPTTTLELRADVQLGNLVFNTIDSDGYMFIVTELTGLLGTPEAEYPELSKGMFRDGDYDTDGRYVARNITLAGSILVTDPKYVSDAHNKLIEATNLVRSGAWLKLRSLSGQVRAMFVRLNGSVQADVVTARGRIGFSLGLKASDPVLYEWNEERRDGYTVATVYAKNKTKNHTGRVELGNKGNYPVGGIYSIKGPVSSGTAIGNYANGEFASVIKRLRGERMRSITKKQFEDGVATLTFSTPHDFSVGDTIIVSLAEQIPVSGIERISGQTAMTVTSSQAQRFSVGDIVYLDQGKESSVREKPYKITSVSSGSFVVETDGTTAFSWTGLVSLAHNLTNQSFNGLRSIASTPSSLSIQFLASSLYTSSLVSVASSDQATMTNVVYRDSDILTINTYENEAYLNGLSTGARGFLNTIADWIKLEAGSNLIQIESEDRLPIYVERRSINSAGLVTLRTHSPHGLVSGDTIELDRLPTQYQISDTVGISAYSQANNVVTFIANNHGYTNTDSVVISSVSLGIDGTYSVTNLSSNTFSVVVDSNAKVVSSLVDGFARKIISVLSYAKSVDTCQLEISDASGFASGDTVFISDVHVEFDGRHILTNVNTSTNIVKYSTKNKVSPGLIETTTTPENAQIAKRYVVLSTTPYSLTYQVPATGSTETNVNSGTIVSSTYSGSRSVSEYNLFYNTVTLTTSTPHNFVPGELLNVQSFDNPSLSVMYGDAIAITNCAINGTKVVLTTASAHGYSAEDDIVVYNINSGISGLDVNGSYNAVATTSGTTITYDLTTGVKLSYKVVSKQILDEEAIITIADTEDIQFSQLDTNGLPTKVVISGLSSPYDGKFELTDVELRNNTVRYALPGQADSGPNTVTSGTLGLVFQPTVEKAYVYRELMISHWEMNNSATNVDKDLAGDYVHLTMRSSSYGLQVGDTIEISGVSPLIDGIRKITRVSGTSVTVQSEYNSLVKHKTAQAARANGSATITFTASGHGLNTGDFVYLVNPLSSLISAGRYQVSSRPDEKTFTITGTLKTKYTNTASIQWFTELVNGRAVKAYPVLDNPAPTDYTLSYRKVAANVANAVANSTGEIYQVSDTKLTVYYRSGWIG